MSRQVFCAAVVATALACEQPIAVPGPRLEGVMPPEVVEGEAATLAIAGQNFFPALRLSAGRGARGRAEFVAMLGAVPLTPVTWVSNQQLTAPFPRQLGPGLYDLRVETAAGDEAILERALRVVPRPVVTSDGVVSAPSGAVTFDVTDTVITVPVTPPVDPARSLLIFNIAHPSLTPTDGQVSGQLAADGTTVRFERYGAGGAFQIALRWRIIEHRDFVVQRGVVPHLSSPTEVTLPTPVALARSFALISLRISGGNYNFNDWARAELTSTTTLTLTSGIDEQNPNAEIAWQVVTFAPTAGATVQTGAVDFAIGDAVEYGAVQPAALGRSLLVFSHESIDWSAVAADNLIAGRQVDDQTLVFERDQTNLAARVTWYLVTWSAWRVAHGTMSFAAGQPADQVALPCPAAHAAAGALLPSFMRQGRSPFSGDDTPGVAWFITDLLDDDCTLGLWRGATDDVAVAHWSVFWL